MLQLIQSRCISDDSKCFTEKESDTTCDKYCSHVIGKQSVITAFIKLDTETKQYRYRHSNLLLKAINRIYRRHYTLKEFKLEKHPRSYHEI